MRTKEQIEARIKQCVKQRDHACDVLGKEILGWTYQLEINELVDELDALERCGPREEEEKKNPEN